MPAECARRLFFFVFHRSKKKKGKFSSSAKNHTPFQMVPPTVPSNNTQVPSLPSSTSTLVASTDEKIVRSPAPVDDTSGSVGHSHNGEKKQASSDSRQIACDISSSNGTKSSGKKQKNDNKQKQTQQQQQQKKLRILCIHGHMMTGEIFKAKIGAIRSATKSIAEWHFPDGPINSADAGIPEGNIIDRSDDKENTSSPHAECCSSSTSPLPESTVVSSATMTAAANVGNGNGDMEDPVKKETPEAAVGLEEEQKQVCLKSWIDFSHSTDQERIYKGLNESFAVLDAFCQEHGPFDGVFAFSQGAMIVSMWLALRQQRRNDKSKIATADAEKGAGVNNSDTHRLPSCLPDSLYRQPLRFVIVVSGLVPRDTRWRAQLENSSPAACARAVDSHGSAGDGQSSANDEHNENSHSDTSSASLERSVSPPLKTLHMYGENDGHIVPAESEALRKIPLYADPTTGAPPLVSTHSGGHVVASELRKPIKTFLQSILSQS